MKVCFDIDNKTTVEFLGGKFEPEIVIRTSEGLLVKIFGTKDELKKFANEIYEFVHQ